MVGIGSLLLMCSYAGLVIFAFYDIQGCDPIKAKLVEKPDQLFPLFVMQVMGDIPAIPGLFVAGVFSGALSTVSSGLNSLAAVVLQDLCVSAANKTLIFEKQKVKTQDLKIYSLFLMTDRLIGLLIFLELPLVHTVN